MNVKSLKLVYFSPTGTTKQIVQQIAQGIDVKDISIIDVTLPNAREERLDTSENELLIIGMPVYKGRIPPVATTWLQSIRAKNTPTVCVAVYGNRAYDDALVELNEMVLACGGIPIAGGAYIGEHSFSAADTPIAKGRPNPEDLNHAQRFGQQIESKLSGLSSFDSTARIPFPGSRPEGDAAQPWGIHFATVSEKCTQCGICAKQCPVGAIDKENSQKVNKEICITCCACIKKCPRQARTRTSGRLEDTAKRLQTMAKEPKKPVIFL